MGSFNSRPQSQNPTEQRSFTEARQFVAEHGVDGIGEFYRKQIEAWRDITLNFVITGPSGSGKSSFINAIRGLSNGKEGAAKVGVVEKTSEPTPYPHPSNPKIIFWDVPGIGTPTYPNIEKYCKEINLEKYDAFLLFARGRFTDHDLELATKAKSINKPFFFIRAHMETELTNSKRDNGLKFEEKETLEEMRKDCFKNLGKLLTSKNDIYLIDNYVKDKWDFERLIAAITNVLPERRRECLTLSLSNVTRDCLKRKAKALKVRAGLLAAATAPSSAIPVPLVGAAMDIALIWSEAIEYRKQFGLPAVDSIQFESLKEDYQKRIKKYQFLSATKLAIELGSEGIAELGAEEIAKYIPIAGTIIACAISAAFTSRYLIRCINELEEVALKIWDDASS